MRTERLISSSGSFRVEALDQLFNDRDEELLHSIDPDRVQLKYSNDPVSKRLASIRSKKREHLDYYLAVKE